MKWYSKCSKYQYRDEPYLPFRLFSAVGVSVVFASETLCLISLYDDDFIEHSNGEDRNYAAAGRRFSGMVPASYPRCGAGRALGCARLHGDPPLGIRYLGKYAAAARRHVSCDRTPQCLLPTFHSTELFREGSRARRRLRQGMCRRYPQSARSRCGRKIAAIERLDRAAGGSANIGNDY